MPVSPIFFASLTRYQADFFSSVAGYLTSQGATCLHIVFHQSAATELAARGDTVVDVFAAADGIGDPPDFDTFGIDNPSLLLSHEKVFYGLRDSDALEAKLRRYLGAIDRAIREHAGDRPERAAYVQELGGFASVTAGFFAARRRGLRHVFLEPSLFRGRLFCPVDSFAAVCVGPEDAAPASDEVVAFVEDAVSRRRNVIPSKDRRHYRGALAKLTDPYNYRRLAEKLWQKHAVGEREEFEHIGEHVRRHVRMAWTGARMRGLYRPLAALTGQGQSFVYYPLHVPTDFALTVRAPLYLDQYALIDYIARNLPPGHRLAVKEHPALVGALDLHRVRDLLRRNDRLDFLDPATNNYAAMEAAAAIVTVNSKSGAEAMLLGRPVLVLGDSFYRDSPLVTRVDRLDGLPAAMRQACIRHRPPDRSRVCDYVQGVWNRTVPGELFDSQPANVATMAGSLDRLLSKVPGDR